MSLIEVDHYEDALVNGQWHWLPYFHPEELADRYSKRLKIEPLFMDWLVRVRLVYNRAMIITSGYREKDHPEEVKKPQPGAHHYGVAADVLMKSMTDGYSLMQIATNHGVHGIGAKLQGQPDDIIHLDRWEMRERGTFWTYPGAQPWLMASSTLQKAG